MIAGFTPTATAQVLSPLERFAFRSPSLDESGLGARGSVSVLGDIDADGVPEIAAGAANEDSNAGRVYVLSGTDGRLVAAFGSSVDVEAEGLGAATAGPGDLNGDGTPDVVVGAPGGDPNGVSGAGRVYAIDVTTLAVLWTAVSPNAEEDGAFGITLTAVPDMTGDGVSEVAVGATEEGVRDAGGSLEADAGRAYLLNGATGAVLQILSPVEPDDESPVLAGTRGSDLGFSLGATLNGQGRGMWIAGAPGEWEGNFDVDTDIYSGRVYVIQADGTGGRYKSTNSQNRGNFGHAVAGTPDLDGDGVGDVLVGAVSESLTPDDDNEGQVYLLSGASGTPLRRYISPQSFDDSSFGADLDVVSDVTDDGTADLVMTESTSCCDKIDALYVFDGATGDLAASLEVPNTRFDINTAVGMPDLDGDGRSELAVGMSVGTFDEVDYVVVVPVAAAEAEIEPNDLIAAPQKLSGTSPLVVRGVAGGGDAGFGGTRLLVQPDDGEVAEDLFLVETTAPGLTVTLSDFGTAEDEDMDVWVLDPESLSILGSAATLDAVERVTLPTLPAGRYLIAVDFYGEFGDASNTFDYAFYTLTVEGAFTFPVGSEGTAPAALALEAPFPNPTRDDATIAYTLEAPGPVRLVVIDALGREVARLVDEARGAGRHTASLDGTRLAPGVYRVRLEAGARTETRALVIAR